MFANRQTYNCEFSVEYTYLTDACVAAGSAAAPRSRNDSLLSVAGLSDCSEATLADSVFAGTSATGAGSSSRGSCPPTPPTFRLSKRRQAQLRDKQRKRGSLTASMLSKVSASLRSHQNIGEEHRFSRYYNTQLFATEVNCNVKILSFSMINASVYYVLRT